MLSDGWPMIIGGLYCWFLGGLWGWWPLLGWHA